MARYEASGLFFVWMCVKWSGGIYMRAPMKSISAGELTLIYCIFNHMGYYSRRQMLGNPRNQS